MARIGKERRGGLLVTTRGPTDWSPDTKKFVLYDWQTGKKALAIAIGADGTSIRKCPSTAGQMGYAEKREWQAHGSPLRCIAIVVVTRQGWEWRPYDGQISWAAKDWRAEKRDTGARARATA